MKVNNKIIPSKTISGRVISRVARSNKSEPGLQKSVFNNTRLSQIKTKTNKVNVKNASTHAWPTVVYFDQGTGAPHAVCWLKSIFNGRK